MVKELVGSGQHYRSFLEEQGYNLRNFSKLFFKQDGEVNGDLSPEEKAILEKLANLPEYDDRSLWVTNILNTDKSAIRLLLVPKDTPRLKDYAYPVTGGMPDSSESYLVEVRNNRRVDERCKVPVLHSNPKEASDIARRKFNSEIGAPIRFLQASAELVSPEEWIEHCRHLILDKGEVLPDFITRFADLRECQEQAQRERLSNMPSTILQPIVR